MPLILDLVKIRVADTAVSDLNADVIISQLPTVKCKW